MGEFRSMAEILDLQDLWADKLPERKYAPDGGELFSSRMRRAYQVHLLQQGREKADPAVKAERERAALQNAAQDRAQRSRELEDRYWAEMPSALERMGLEAQETAALAELEDRPGVLLAKGWLLGGKLFLTLGGRVGGGKTIAAASLLVAKATERLACDSVEGRVWNAARARFVKAQALARMSLYGQESHKAMERLKLVGLLVIDDLGAESKADGWASLFDELIDARARLANRTCITTNLSSKELEARYGQRVFRRLRDFGEFVAVDQTRGREVG